MYLVSLFHKIAIRFVRKLQSSFGIMTLGVRAIILDSDHNILLVKHTYHDHWHLPGGGVKKAESAKTALLRELEEEVGVSVKEEPELFGIYFHTHLGVHDYPIIYVIKHYSIVKVKSLEIEQMAWFSYDKLPTLVSRGTKARLDEFFTDSVKADHW